MLHSRFFSLFMFTIPLLLRSQIPVSIHQQQHEFFREIYTAAPDTSIRLPAPLQRRFPGPLLEVFGYHPASSGVYTAVLSWPGGVSSQQFVLLK
tara:strand:- start:14305 stop:14586 length:282 start_codon:yes stop_codon:yes gene_type:complete